MADRLMIQTLAFAAREFDHLYDSLVVEAEPGPEEVADEPGAADDAADEFAAVGPSPTSDAATTDEPEGTGRSGKAVHRLKRVASAAVGVARAGVRGITGTVHPRAEAWPQTDADSHIDWWQGRMSTAVAALAALPSATGRIGRALGVVDAIGAAGQILMVNAVGRELGAEQVERIRVAGQIVFGEELTPEEIEAELARGDDELAQPDAEEDAQLDAQDGERSGRLGRTARLVRTVASRVRRLRSSLSERQRGHLLARIISNLPVIGAAGGFLSERSGMKRAAEEARRAFSASA